LFYQFGFISFSNRFIHLTIRFHQLSLFWKKRFQLQTGFWILCSIFLAFHHFILSVSQTLKKIEPRTYFLRFYLSICSFVCHRFFLLHFFLDLIFFPSISIVLTFSKIKRVGLNVKPRSINPTYKRAHEDANLIQFQ